MSCLLFPVELVAVGSLTVRRPCVETGVPQGGVLCILAVVGSHARTSRDFQTVFPTPNKCLVDLVWLTGRLFAIGVHLASKISYVGCFACFPPC